MPKTWDDLPPEAKRHWDEHLTRRYFDSAAVEFNDASLAEIGERIILRKREREALT